MARIAGSLNLIDPEATKSTSSSKVCLFTSFSSVFLVGSVKSKVTQQRLTLLTKRFIFSELGTSLKGTRGSIPAITLAGKTADEVRFGPLDLAEPAAEALDR
uniref:Uncharacterized protein n=1 Tax=Rhizophora mucronata TaxID=61149 RepID=A0A2P2ILJ7_RHIMU